MRILVVGAGAVGGWFGGQLALAGRDVTFLVRGERARILRSNGLVLERLESPGELVDGKTADRAHTGSDTRLTTIADPQVVTADGLDAPYDIVLVSVKAYGLEQALTDLTPAVGPETTVVPMLNGMLHVERLVDLFGERVVGGLCFVATELTAAGVVRQLGPLSTVAVGDLDTSTPGRAQTVYEAMAGSGFRVTLTDDIVQALWEKWFVLAAGGAVTTLLGADIGHIVAVAGGLETVRSVVRECGVVAAAAGHAPSEVATARALAALTEAGSTFTTSMYRDRAAGGEVESRQILGDLVHRAGELGVAVPLLTAASAGLEIYRSGRPTA